MQQRRGAARHKLFEPVTIEVHGQPFRAHLLDLSCSGALAHAETPPLPSARLAIALLGLAMPARVMWVRGKRFGLCFDLSLPQTTIDRLLRATGVPAPRAEQHVRPMSLPLSRA